MKKLFYLCFIFLLCLFFTGCVEPDEKPVTKEEPEVVLVSIELKQKGKDSYYVDEKFDISNYVFTALYSDNSSKEIDLTSDMIIVDLSKPGTINAKISYTENTITKETTFNIEVKEVIKPVSIEVKEMGKTKYYFEQTLDLTEYVFLVKYSNNTSKEVKLDNSCADITTFNENLTDDTEKVTINITYNIEKVTLKTSFEVENLSEWCYEEYFRPIEEQELVNQIYEQVQQMIPTDVDSTSEDIVLLTNEDFNTYKVIMSWTSSNAIVIGTNGKINVGEDDEIVTLNLFIKCNYIDNVEYKFPINVKGLGPVVFPTFDMSKKHVFAYYYEGTYREITEFDAGKIDVLNYCFASVGADGKLSVAGLGHLSQVLEWRRAYKLRVVLCIGGGGAGISDAFTSACSDASKRKIFIDSIIEVLNKYKFDGIDIDWEYPKKNIEVKLFTTFVKELREAMNTHKEGLLLTAALIAGGSISNVKEYYDCVELNKYLDYAHLMTYDLNSVETASHNSNPLAGRAYSAESSMNYYHAAGFDYNKIVLGAAFYGKMSELQTPTTATSAVLNKPVIKDSTKTLKFSTIQSDYLSNSEYVKLYDAACGAYYLTNGKYFITFENRESIDKKGQLIKQNNLGGLMFWDFGSDSESRTLLQAVFAAVYEANR